MIVTIIGSCSKSRDKIEACKNFFETMGVTVYSPVAQGREEVPLIQKQTEWIRNIFASDLIVAIPKNMDSATSREEDEGTKFEVLFGESTSYEMAIAHRFNKPIMIF